MRDYLEQEHIWLDLLSYNKQPDFDPKTSLLAADVLELKSTEVVSNFSSIYDCSVEAIVRVGRLAPADFRERNRPTRRTWKSNWHSLAWIERKRKRPQRVSSLGI